MSTAIRKFDKDSTLPSEVADQVVQIFRKNYPSSHSSENREKDMAERASRIQKPSCLLLEVHPDNPAKKVYESWGYTTDNKISSDGKIFMFKDL